MNSCEDASLLALICINGGQIFVKKKNNNNIIAMRQPALNTSEVVRINVGFLN